MILNLIYKCDCDPKMVSKMSQEFSTASSAIIVSALPKPLFLPDPCNLSLSDPCNPNTFHNAKLYVKHSVRHSLPEQLSQFQAWGFCCSILFLSKTLVSLPCLYYFLFKT